MTRITKKKTGIMLGMVYLIVFAIFNMLVFFLAGDKNGVFWTSYVFMCVAFVVQIISMLLAFGSMEVESAFFGISLASFSLYYFFAAVFTGAVFMFFQVAPFKLAFALQVIILAAYAIVTIVTIFTRDAVQDIGDEIRENVAAVRVMQVDVESLQEMAADPTLKKSLRKLSDTIKYSDPMSNEAVSDIENQIMSEVEELRIYCENEQKEEAVRKCQTIELLFLQRNKLLRATK